MAGQPDFLAVIEDCKCINISAHTKQLQPAIDLVTQEKQQNLTYVLDIFPGLYFQRMKPAGPQPRITNRKPVLIVSMVPGSFRHGTNPSDPTTLINRETSVTQPASLQSYPSANTAGRVMENSQGLRSTIPRSHDVEDANNREKSVTQPSGLQYYSSANTEGRVMENSQGLHSTIHRSYGAEDENDRTATKPRRFLGFSSRCKLSRHPKNGVRSGRVRRESPQPQRRRRSPGAGCVFGKVKTWWR
jgi:hypothetical protein